ncbi:MAG: hypothetical protein IJA72_04620 [Clostridia bacterium]|nr:hypothetical protein [Clostridia bacterium]
MYKVLANDIIVGVIDEPSYVRYQNRNGKFLSCDKHYAQGVLSQDGNIIWHLKDRAVIPVSGYTTVELIEIEQDEYEMLKSIFDNKDEYSDESAVLDAVQEATLEVVATDKINKMKQECGNAITSGFDITLSDGNIYHFTLTLEDQINMIELKNLYDLGEEQIPYHSSGELCKYYSANDIDAILKASDAHKNYHIVYYNSLRNYIKSLTDITKLNSIEYGSKIPKKYQSEVLKKIMEDKS